ncbi:uncharacterized protein LOC111780482 [Cucurbita pepo subsp. pepo]|uniref:uncharacterized protein LOC111780482 n=1 Tax=Cucurbita pepo subsp. pepo TaxID=3664 RepID=UPI000C9D57F5|nr:uncharacterized protein LOC111780482 [Cucurbita pepo subsp. pepo]
MVEVVKATLTKKTTRRRDCRAKKISVEEDAIEEEVADKTFSAINNCGRMGHVAKACRAKKRVEGTTYLAVEDVTDEGLLLMAQDEENINNDTLWYLDSRASNHMCDHKHLFKEMQKIEDGHVSFGDASKVEVKGRGMIHFLQKDGVIGSIQDVYYVPDLKTNIFSMGQLTEKGYLIFLKDRLLHLKDKKERLVARVEIRRN